MVALTLYNSYTRTTEQFIPLKQGEVRLYTCGPTVYNYAHIGNLRAFVFEDILHRVLQFNGYSVDHVMNITDVGHLSDDGDEGEDKMIKTAREKGMTVWDIADFFTKAFFEDTKKLAILQPDTICRATKHIGDMIALIRRLEKKGHTYIAGGNVYFSIDTFPKYGKMAMLDKQELQDGSRIGVDQNKKNPRDFVLWFTNSKFEHQAMVWDSPWGKGYPGWHIECSAMSMKYLGEQIDIHCGGIDHIPVHHTNEIAQSEAATGKKWVNYWLHNEFLIMETGKMSKSKGNFLTLGTLEDNGYNPMDYRYLLLNGHYRSQLKFSYDSLDTARNARTALYQKIIRLRKEAGDTPIENQESETWVNSFKDAVSADLNTPRGLSELWKMTKDDSLTAVQKLATAFVMDRVLGLGLDKVEEELAEISQEVKDLIEERELARKNKEWAKSDELRDKIAEHGIQVVDTPKGTTWKKIL